MHAACENSPADPRSYDLFEDGDLARLLALAEQDLAGFVNRNPRHATLPGRVLLVALCQGAALHYVDGQNGVKDFDVWTFFAADEGSSVYPPRRIGRASYDGPRFAESTGRVDLLGRTLPVETGADPVTAVQAYLRRGATGTAAHLGRKAVVALAPARLRGRVIWLRGEPR